MTPGTVAKSQTRHRRHATRCHLGYAVSGECAFEPDTCDKTYAGTFQYVDADCAYGGDGGVGCVGNQGCRFCRLITRARPALA